MTEEIEERLRKLLNKGEWKKTKERKEQFEND